MAANILLETILIKPNKIKVNTFTVNWNMLTALLSVFVLITSMSAKHYLVETEIK